MDPKPEKPIPHYFDCVNQKSALLSLDPDRDRFGLKLAVKASESSKAGKLGFALQAIETYGFAEGKNWILLPSALIFLPRDLDFPSIGFEYNCIDRICGLT
jgi:hypothetical protein